MKNRVVNRRIRVAAVVMVALCSTVARATRAVEIDGLPHPNSAHAAVEPLNELTEEQFEAIVHPPIHSDRWPPNYNPDVAH